MIVDSCDSVNISKKELYIFAKAKMLLTYHHLPSHTLTHPHTEVNASKYHINVERKKKQNIKRYLTCVPEEGQGGKSH